MSKTYILWFKEIDKNDIATVGGKGANLGEMVKAGFPVPDGFCVTANAYFDFLEKGKILATIKKILSELDIHDSSSLQKKAKEIQEQILKTSTPEIVEKEIISAYQKLSGKKDKFVAIRSSATAEDLPEASFAGQQESFMNMRGQREVLMATKRCWASLFTSRAIFYREQKGFDHLQVGLAVPIQEMIQSEVSGVMFTLDPITNDLRKIAIEAAFGLGDAVVSGSITPDQYLVDKESLAILDKKIISQKKMLASTGKTGFDAKGQVLPEQERFQFVPVSKAYQNKQKLVDKNISQLAALGKKIEQHYNFPQDIEWAYKGGRLCIVQTRPVTTIDLANRESRIANRISRTSDTSWAISDMPLLEGIPASPGIACGPVRVIKSVKEIGKVKKGEVLVTEMTNPDFVPAMKRAVAIVTDRGGRTSHAAIVSRELGIPCVVGAQQATKMLKTGEVITVDGGEGKVYEGEVRLDSVTVRHFDSQNRQIKTVQPSKTATKLFVNLGEPELAEEVAQKNVDGVGLLRAEFIISQINKHPRYMLEQKKRDEFIDKLDDGILQVARAFNPRPVIYRSTDFKTNEYKNLKGGEKYEEEETNPMLGFRGALRYLADSEVFRMELAAIKHVRRYHKNLWLMLPFLRTVKELKECKKILAEEGLSRGGSFKLFIMVEVPSTVILLDKFIGVGIDGVSIGSNDLTQLILGLDRDNAKVANLFDERDEAVMWAIKHVISTCRKHGISSSICGQAPSIYEEFVQELVEWGITSISVSPDAITQTRDIIAKAEYDKIVRRM
ncbi:MAG: phosphoenolpyruvate synthase [Candidatus Cloacimonetes bacterium]|nr:phosphoenolpyruvate synthase [Candidatus Cloacimonadota bacterium]